MSTTNLSDSDTRRFTFSIFTPCFNRAHTLPRVFQSLESQTFRDFEWIIVDDGSTDGTASLVQTWQQTAVFPIRYLQQENQGKHIAHNWAIREARGELFLTFDSDDACVAQALERFKFYWDSIAPDRKPHFYGVTGLCVDQDGKPVGDPMPAAIVDSDAREMFYRYRARGEMWGFGQTRILRQFPFPEDVRNQYLPEGLIWFKIAQQYKTRYVNEVLRIYYRDQPSMTWQRPSQSHAVGRRRAYQAMLNDDIGYFKDAPVWLMGYTAYYVRFSLTLGTNPVALVRDINNWPARFLVLMMFPLGLLLYLRDGLSVPALPHSVQSRLTYWRILMRNGTFLKYLTARALAASGLSKFLYIKQNGFDLHFYPSSLSIALWTDRNDRSQDEDFMRKYLQAGDVFIDVGANIGNLTIPAAASVTSTGKVYAIEPHPRIFKYLESNLQLNHVRNVCTFNVALGNRDAAITLSNQRTDDMNHVVQHGHGMEVMAHCLDSLPIEAEQIALLKIDVEGYEKFVLQGAGRILANCECVYFESWEDHFKRFDYSGVEVLKLLFGAGFGLYKPDADWELIPISLEYRSVRCENLLAVRDPKAFALRMSA